MARRTKNTGGGATVTGAETLLPDNTVSSDTGAGVILPETAASAGLSATDIVVTETSTEDDVMVQPTRYFTDSATGVFRTPSDDPFSVNRRRAAELYENGLVREVKPQPDNRMAPDPQTKE